MAEALMCESCGKVARTTHVSRWLKVQSHADFVIVEYGADLSTSRPVVGDFCSTVCLAEAATLRVAFEAERDAYLDEVTRARG